MYTRDNRIAEWRLRQFHTSATPSGVDRVSQTQWRRAMGDPGRTMYFLPLRPNIKKKKKLRPPPGNTRVSAIHIGLVLYSAGVPVKDFLIQLRPV